MITPKYPNLMNRGPMNLPQSPEDMLKQLINACDFFSHWFPGQCFGLKAAITELIPDVKSRNWQRAINGIDIKRDILIWQLEQRTDVPGGIKEHQKEGIRGKLWLSNGCWMKYSCSTAGSYSTAERK